MTRREVKAFQKARARRHDYETQRNVRRRNQKRMRGPLDIINVARSAKRPSNWLELWVRQAVRTSSVAQQRGNSLIDVLMLVGISVLLAMIVYWLTGCTPRY
jgi:hypothetical protein